MQDYLTYEVDELHRQRLHGFFGGEVQANACGLVDFFDPGGWYYGRTVQRT